MTAAKRTYVQGVRDAMDVLSGMLDGAFSSQQVLLRVAEANVAKLIAPEQPRSNGSDDSKLLAFVDSIAARVVAGAEVDIAAERQRRLVEKKVGGHVLSTVVLNPVETLRWIQYAVSREIPGAVEVLAEIRERGVGGEAPSPKPDTMTPVKTTGPGRIPEFENSHG